MIRRFLAWLFLDDGWLEWRRKPPAPTPKRRGYGFNPQEVANLRSWGYEPRPDEVIPTFETPQQTSRTTALEFLARQMRNRSQVELEADQRRRQADCERAMGLRPR